MSSTSRPLIIVTGATGNLGRVAVAELEARGKRVLRVERHVVRDGEQCLCEIDLEQPDSVQQVFGTIAERVGPIEGLVHTVGLYRGGSSLLETATEDFAALFLTNALTTVHVLRAALARMVPRKQGRIAVVVSAGALAGSAGAAAYAASKAAQLRIVESAAAELGDRGVTLNAVLPGTLDTPQNRAANPSADPTRWVKLERLAQLLATLVEPQSAALHGQVLKIGEA